jgi:uncharacterized membrane protein
LGISAFYAVYAEWAKKQPPQMYYGDAAIVDINLNNDHTVFLKTGKSRSLKIWIALMKLGAISGCHQMRERSFFFWNYQFPVCARCTGLFFGEAASIALFFLFLNFNIKPLLLCAAFSVALLGTDGLLQLKGMWVSTNSRRLVTGLLCGFFVTGLLIRIAAVIIHHLT